jgi:hypothetical protein
VPGGVVLRRFRRGRRSDANENDAQCRSTEQRLTEFHVFSPLVSSLVERPMVAGANLVLLQSVDSGSYFVVFRKKR